MAFFSANYMDPYVVEDDDSSACETSSDDEIDVILHGTPKQKRRLKMLQNKPVDRQSSSEDEFEKEMNAELNQQISHLETERGFKDKMLMPGTSSETCKSMKQLNGTEQDEFYDDVYFDSDEEDGAGNKMQHSVISNDDLLYDPTMDDKDQQWVDKQRRKHGSMTPTRSKQSGGNKNKKLKAKPTSDALLDCPACLTTVCIDCQSHETYKNQYRAMFVMNCVVDKSEQLQCPEQPTKKKKKNVQPQPPIAPSSANTTDMTTINSSSDLFNPVRCSECNTVIAVIDVDEVYHFFNIIASHT